jgi:hypothetical protein
MKRRSDKRQQREAEAQPWRDAKILEVNCCEVCRWKPRTLHRLGPAYLCVHEIASGADRQKALDKAYAVLVVCNYCNTTIHGWPKERQLAVLLLRRPADFDLDAFNELRGRRYDKDRVAEWLRG